MIKLQVLTGYRVSSLELGRELALDLKIESVPLDYFNRDWPYTFNFNSQVYHLDETNFKLLTVYTTLNKIGD